VNLQDIQLGMTGVHSCGYLPQQQESLIFTLPDQPLTAELYLQLMQMNFRRTGEQLYRPYCSSCQACQSVRIDPTQFSASTSQRKLWKKAHQQNWHYRLNDQPAWQDYYPLYHDYICTKHQDGVMFPPTPEQLASMFDCQWLPIFTLEQYINDKLVGVLIIDALPGAWSAVYSFYQTSSTLALGKLAILATLVAAKAQMLQQLYLGFYISDCQKMAYKADFGPQQRLIGHKWQSFD
jgi:arginyl-tRNA--protein-N-Asp/Glu arginylyltransferase